MLVTHTTQAPESNGEKKRTSSRTHPALANWNMAAAAAAAAAAATAELDTTERAHNAKWIFGDGLCAKFVICIMRTNCIMSFFTFFFIHLLKTYCNSTSKSHQHM